MSDQTAQRGRTRRRAALPGAVALAVLLAACTTGPSGTGDRPSVAPSSPAASPFPTQPASTRSPAPSIAPTPTTRPFVSVRHGYRLEVPPGWLVNEYEGTWTELDQFDPGAEVPGEDVVATLDYAAFLVINSMPLQDGMSDVEWLEAFDGRVAGGVDPACPVTRSQGTVGGEPASIAAQPCDGSMIIGRSLTHGGRGYYFTTRAPADDAATQAILDRVVGSIGFSD